MKGVATVILSFTLGCGAPTAHEARPATTSAPPPTRAAACTSDAECGPGYACCYPCGIDGCENTCMPVRAGEGCPEIP